MKQKTKSQKLKSGSRAKAKKGQRYVSYSSPREALFEKAKMVTHFSRAWQQSMQRFSVTEKLRSLKVNWETFWR